MGCNLVRRSLVGGNLMNLVNEHISGLHFEVKAVACADFSAWVRRELVRVLDLCVEDF